jgi:hypothetical protein
LHWANLNGDGRIENVWGWFVGVEGKKKEEKSEISLLPVLERVGKYVPSEIRTLGWQ